MGIATCIGMIEWVNTIDGPTKLVCQDAIFGGLSIGQLLTSFQNYSLRRWQKVSLEIYLVINANPLHVLLQVPVKATHWHKWWETNICVTMETVYNLPAGHQKISQGWVDQRIRADRPLTDSCSYTLTKQLVLVTTYRYSWWVQISYHGNTMTLTTGCC